MTNRWFGSLGFLSTEELLLSGRWGVGLPGGGGGTDPGTPFRDLQETVNRRVNQKGNLTTGSDRKSPRARKTASLLDSIGFSIAYMEQSRLPRCNQQELLLHVQKRPAKSIKR